MVREILKIRTDNGLEDNNPTFKGIELTDYSAKFPRMGMPSLSATLKWATPLDDEWTRREYVTLREERFYIRHTPSGKKDNQDSRYNHEIEFTSEFAEILGNTYFEDAVPSYSATYDKPCSNNSRFTFYGTIAELVDRLNCSFLKAGIGDSILNTKTNLTTQDTPVGDGFCVMLDPFGEGDVYDPDKSYEFSWEDKTHWESITEGYNITKIPFESRGRKIIFGATPNVVEHKFEYGHDNELLSVYHKNANAKVINRITMYGSSENIPHYYPNETEYGHINIEASPENDVLITSNLSIKNMTQLLSRLNADKWAVLGKYGEDVSYKPDITINTYQIGVQSAAYQKYTLKKDLMVCYERGEIYCRVLVNFSLSEQTQVWLSRVNAKVWQANGSPSSEYHNCISAVTPILLHKMTDDTYEHRSEILTGNLKKEEDGSLYLGNLDKGFYSLGFKIFINDGSNVFVSFINLEGVDFDVEAKYAKTGYYWQVGDKKYDGVGSLGVALDIPVTDEMIGDGFHWVASGRMPFQDHLVPPKYRNTLGAERFYNALNTPYTEAYALAHQDAYIDPDTNHPYNFPNPYIEGSPSEHIYNDDEIKPTIEGVTNAVQRKDVNGALMFDENGNPIYQMFGEIADIAYDVDDNDALKAESTEDNDKNDSLKYEHSFFYIKLNIFNGTYGFDLFAHASQTDAMTIQMRDGSCNGCKFKIQAVKFTDDTGLETYKNPIAVRNGKAVGVVSEDGIKESDLDPTQQNTQTHSIWICVQKDASTFGRIYPNKGENIKPKIGDKFNIINIDLPQAYIFAAEKRLEEEGMRFMSDNNEEKFTFDIQASRIFFAENPQVLAQLDEYSVIKVTYNGKEYEQYVNQLTIDCKDSEALPNIGIDLTDTLAVGQSFVDQVAERASSLIANPYTMGGALGSGGGGLTTRLADQRYLKKTESDRSKGKIASDVGFEVGDFVSGGSGGIFYQDPETGQTYIEADKLKIRMKAIFEELEIAKVSTIGGKFIITPGGGINISFVEERTNSYRCYFKAKEENEKAECRMVVGDQVQCMEFSVGEGQYKNVATRYYWRLVTAVNNDESYIELSKTDRDNAYDIPSDAPQAGDTIVQLGNRNDDKRQSAIILSTVDTFAPCVTLYNGIDHYSLDGKEVVEYGVDKTKSPAEPFFNCYGRFYFGPRSRASFLEFNPSTMMLEYKGILHIDSKIGDKTIENYVKGIIPLTEYDYLKQALWQDTTITNGLILTSAVSLGYKDNNGVRHTTAGMSGIYNHPKSIASWWGGDMVDKYYQNKTVQNILTVEPRPTELTTGYAQALIRMDGSGYFAGGNIRWTESGAMTFGSGIVIDLGGGKSSTFEGIGNSLSSLTLLLDKFAQAFVPIVIENGQKKETNWGSITSIDDLYAIKAKKGFYSDSFISARGVNPDGSSGGGATQLRMLDDVLIGNDLASGQSLVYNGSKWVNQKAGLDESSLSAYLTTNKYAKLTDIPSLTGYATEQWVENKNYLTDYTIHALTLQAGAFTAKNYNPKTGAATVNIPTTTSHISEGTRLYFTDARAQNALASTVTDLNTAIGAKLPTATFETFKSGYDTWKGNVDAFMTKFNSMFAKETVGSETRIKALFGLYTDQFLSARGINPNGSSGGGLIQNVYGWSDLGGSFSNSTLTDTFNAYTINKIWTDKADKTWVESKGYLTGITKAMVEAVLTGNITSHTHSQYLTTSLAASTYVAQETGKGLSSNDFTDTLLTKLNGIEEGANNYVHPTGGANTTISAANGKVLSAITVNSLGHVTSVSSKTLAAADIPTLAISKISGLQTALDGKVAKTGDTMTGDLGFATIATWPTPSTETYPIESKGLKWSGSSDTASIFYRVSASDKGNLVLNVGDDADPSILFEWNKVTSYTFNKTTLLASGVDATFKSLNLVNGSNTVTISVDSSGNLHIGKGLYSDSFISARGANSSGGSGAGGFGLLRTWTDPTNNPDDAFSAQVVWDKINSLPTTSVNPYALTIQKNGTTLGTYDGSVAKTINISDVASASTLSSHTNNTTVHITSDERTKWNNTATNLSAILGADSDTIINKWEEVVAFLDTYTEADTLAGLLSNKADKTVKISAGTGLSGGGTLAADRTLSLATSGVTAGTYFKTTVDTYGRVTAGSNPTTLAGFGITDAYTKTDADTRYVNVSGDTMTGHLVIQDQLSVQKKDGTLAVACNIESNNFFGPSVASTNEILLGRAQGRWANLYSVLGNFSGQVTAQSLKIGDATITYDSATGMLHSDKGFYSDGAVSARGANSSGGSSGGSSFGRLDNWSNYDPNGTDALSAVLGKGLLDRIVSLEGKNYLNDLAIAVTGSGNAVTSVSQSADKKTLTFTKGSTFALSSALGNYLPLSGGTMTGLLKVDNINSTNSNGLLAYHPTSWTAVVDTQWGLGTIDSQGVIRSSNTSLIHYRDGVGNSTIWDAGNDGTGSGLDADLLDGKHNGEVTAKYLNYVASNTWDCNEPTATLHSDYGSSGRSISNRPDGWSYGQLLTIGRQGSFSANLSAQFMWDVQHKTASPGILWFRTRKTLSSTENGWGNWGRLAFTTDNVASATKLADNTARTAWGQTFFENGVPKTVSGDMTGVGSFTGVGQFKYGSSPEDNETYGKYHRLNLGYHGIDHTDFYEAAINFYNNGGSTLYTKLSSSTSYFTGSVGIGTTAPAYKLDVNGIIRASNEVISTSVNAFRGVSDDYGFIIRHDSNAMYFLFTNQNDAYGSYNALRPLYINHSSGLVTMNNGLKVNKITIGSITLEDVGGNLHINKGVYSDSFVSAKGANSSGTGSGGGLIQSVYGSKDLEGSFSDSTLTDTFNAFTIANINSRVKALESINRVSITAAGVSEMGRYIDFHSANWGTNTTEDYTVRLNAGSESVSRIFTFPTTGGTLATQEWVTSKNYLTSHQSLANYVTLNTSQTITGAKTFTSEIYGKKGLSILKAPSGSANVMGCIGFNRDTTNGNIPNADYTAFQFTHKADVLYLEIFNAKNNPYLSIGCKVSASSFIKSGGTSSQFLKADGSVDSNAYLLSSSYTASDVLTKLKTVDGAGSGLDADTLDGIHATGFVIDFGGDIEGKIYDVPSKRVFSGDTLEDAPVSGWISGLALGSNWNNNHYQHYLVESNGRWYATREYENGAMKNWKTFAYLSDNVASATKLADNTSFKAWGKTFFENGVPQSVSGDMTSVGHITPWKDNTADCGSKTSHWNAVRTRQLVSAVESILWIWQSKSQPIGFATNGTERMRITPDGMLGLGITSPAEKLDVAGNVRGYNLYAGNSATNGGIEIYHVTPYIDFHFGRTTDDYTSRIIEEVSGRLAIIGTLRVSVGMYSGGYVSARGQNTSSDKRLKDIIGKVNLNVKQIANAPSVRFAWKSDGTHDIGSIAQYWQGISPLLTPKDLNGNLTLQYGKTALLSVISVAKKTINLEERVEFLEKENKELKRKIEILERR